MGLLYEEMKRFFIGDKLGCDEIRRSVSLGGESRATSSYRHISTAHTANVLQVASLKKVLSYRWSLYLSDNVVGGHAVEVGFEGEKDLVLDSGLSLGLTLADDLLEAVV